MRGTFAPEDIDSHRAAALEHPGIEDRHRDRFADPVAIACRDNETGVIAVDPHGAEIDRLAERLAIGRIIEGQGHVSRAYYFIKQ